MTTQQLKDKAKYVRRTTVEMCVEAGCGHIAPVFSCAEILVALYYGGILRYDKADPCWEGRDRFILSKGQAVAGLNAIMADIGWLSMEECMSHCQDGSKLGGHAEPNVPGVDCYTGSLGHGLSIGCGMAKAAKMKGEDWKVYVLLGDGEMQEGSNWEAMLFAAHHNLDNLVAIVDRNKQQATDFTEDALAMGNMYQKFDVFGFHTTVAEYGNSADEMVRQLSIEPEGKPRAIIANTIKGKGVSFMERCIEYHYRVPETEERLRQALREIEEGF
jgi:transketolase